MQNKADSVIFIDYPLYNGNLFDLDFSRKTLIMIMNQYSFCVAEEDSEFKNALLKSDVLLTDGTAIVKVIQFITGKKIKRYTRATIHEHFLNELSKKGGKCFYLGSSKLNLKKIEDRMAVEYPNITVASYSPPSKSYFSKHENKLMIDTVNAFKPDVLFIGMTISKEEKWAYHHKFQLKVKIICTIGTVFDTYAGTRDNSSSLLNKLGLEWLIRLLKEPKILRNHYLYYWPIFIGLILQNKKSAI